MIKDSSDDRADRKAIEKVSQTSVGLDSLGFVLFWRDATGWFSWFRRDKFCGCAHRIAARGMR